MMRQLMPLRRTALARTLRDRPRGRQVPGRPEAVGGDGLRWRIAQDEKGWLSHRGRWSASPTTSACRRSRCYEVATFYNMYDLQPVGRYKLTVCTNLPCALSRRRSTPPSTCKQKLGIGFDETTADGQLHAEGGRVHGRLRRRAGDAGQQPASMLQLHDAASRSTSCSTS
ncbi:MAG: NAD(P)H-dependent oxidoreductase subunit E [Comamonadaceae bacterium]|nr:NAD(P)H-dependent oxidoreductase subunit E [Comamonadaceae bacterium]